MNHVDPELLALLALGEEAGGPADLEHLDECAECRVELDTLRRAVTVGRSTLDSGDLLEPHPRVWQAIEDELGRAPVRSIDDGRGLAPVRSIDDAAGRPPAPVVPIRRRRWVAVVAAAAAVAVVAGGGTALWLGLRPPPPTVLASATLDPFPAWPDAIGEAVVEQQPDGARVVNVALTAPDTTPGFREVWLISSDASDLISLGILRGPNGTFTIPDGVDLGRFDLVDVSEEPLDGDPEHSGDSIVRGSLSEA